MMISFGRGGGADYLTGETDAKGRSRESVDVLIGDPHEVERLAGSLSFEHKSTTGVIAWAPEDDPTDEQIREVLEEFEKTAWAGLDPDRYAWSAVQHRDGGGGVHVHVLAARVDLETGKSLNVAPPGWQETFDALRDWQNYKNGWARPDDPERARDYEPGHQARIDADLRRSGLAPGEDPRRAITDYLRQRIQAGTVQDRETLVSALREANLEVTRQGKHYITVRDPASNGRWRLKGGIYEKTWTHELSRGGAVTKGRGGPETDRAVPEADRVDHERRARDAFRKLEAARRRRSAFHRARYGVSQPQRGRDPEAARPAGGVPRPERLSRHLDRELGAGAVAVEPHRETHATALPTGGGDRTVRGDRPAAEGPDMGSPAGRGRSGTARGPAAGHAGESPVDRGRSAGRAAAQEVKAQDDRTGTSIDGRLDRAGRAVRAGSEANRRAGRNLAKADRDTDEGFDRVDELINSGRESAHRGGRAVGKTSRVLGGAIHRASRSVAEAVTRLSQFVQAVMRRREKKLPQRSWDRDDGPSR